MVGIEFEVQCKCVCFSICFSFSDDVTIPSGGCKAKDIAQTIFGQKVFMLVEFQSAGHQGCHSIWKFAATHVRRCGISKDDKEDICGRWKGKGHISDVYYDDVELPYPDCKVAEKLCIDGPCFYLVDSSICNSDNIYSHKGGAKYLPPTSRFSLNCPW